MENSIIIPSEVIVSKVYIIRNKKVMFDRDIASLYSVKTRVLIQAVKRNIKRFPEDFMFQLNNDEFKSWRSQIVTSKSDAKGLRRPPYVFTEQGVAMLASVLNSEKAVNVNIQIIRTFVKIRELLETNQTLYRKIKDMEQKYDGQIKEIFGKLKLMQSEKLKPKRKIGF